MKGCVTITLNEVLSGHCMTLCDAYKKETKSQLFPTVLQTFLFKHSFKLVRQNPSDDVKKKLTS